MYENERQRRLTASLFGHVIKRRLYKPCHNIVKACIQPTALHNYVEYGIIKEPVGIKLFEEMTGQAVQPSGLWVDRDFSFLAASPDGKLNQYSLKRFLQISSYRTSGR